MWVQPQADDELLIGATAFGIFLAGEIIAFTSKPKGAEVARVKPLAWPAEQAGLLDAEAYRAHILKLEPEARFV